MSMLMLLKYGLTLIEMEIYKIEQRKYKKERKRNLQQHYLFMRKCMVWLIDRILNKSSVT